MKTRNMTKTTHARRQYLFVLALILGFGNVALGQQTTGSIVGSVKDQQGAVVNKATVKATNLETGYWRSVPVNGYGEYRIDYLPVGRYTVEATAPSFERFVQENVALDVDQTLTVEIKLTVGAQTETVTVTEAPPLVDTSDAELGRTIQPAEIVGLPLVNRNAYSELSLTPGVMANSYSATGNPSGTPNFVVGLPSADVQINGSIDGGNPEVAFYLDGGNNQTTMRNYGNQLPNPDALEEFRVETSEFSAQYGHYSAAVVTAVTKSGTNHFHGALFEFNRNSDFNAYAWGAAPGSAKTPYHRNNFGGNFGGPIKKDKSFFFFSYGGLRQVVGQLLTGAIVPTAPERMGDFTQDTFKVYTPGVFPLTQVNGTNSSPNCGTPTPNCIPSALLDKAVSSMNNVGNSFNLFVPLPNGATHPATGGASYAGNFTGPTTDNEYLGKYDESLGDKDHLAVTYFYIKTFQGAYGGGNIPWMVTDSVTGQTNANVSDVHTFSSTTANQAWLSFTRAMGGRVNKPTTNMGQFGSAFTIQGPSGPPDLSISGDFSAGGGLAGPVTGSDYYSLRDMVSMTKGKQTLVYGGEFALDKTMFLADLYNFGVWTFSGSKQVAGGSVTSTGNSMADFVTGQLKSMEQDTPYVTHLSAWHTALFVQDNYRLTPRFTANLGLRWDIDTAPVDAHDRTAAFVPGQQSTVNPGAPTGMVFPWDSGIGRGIATTKYHHLSPRIGLAWDPWGDGKTAIRAGAGVFYGATSGNEWNQPGNAQPFAVRQTFGSVNSVTNPYATTLSDGATSSFPNGDIFPYVYAPGHPKFLTPAGIESIGPSYQWPFQYQVNLAVQRQLPGRASVTAAYVGTISRHVPTMIDDNYAPYVPGLPGESSGQTGAGGYAARRQYDPGVGVGSLDSNTFLITSQTANYNALQVSGNRPLSHNIMINGFFVWSHAMQSSNESAIGLMSAQDFGVAGNAFTGTYGAFTGVTGGGLKEEVGPMDADRKFAATISGMWKIAFFHGSSFLMKQVVNGWTISPIVYLNSGGPFSPSSGKDNNNDSANANRPNTVPGVKPVLDPHRPRLGTNSTTQEWFNLAAFAQNGPGLGVGPGGADGNAGRDSLRGPGFRDIDMGLFRDITFERGIVFQFRAEATNVFNLVSLSNPTGTLTSGNYGKITGAAGTQRLIQLGGRLTF